MIGALPYGSDQLIDTRMARSGAVTKLTLDPLKGPNPNGHRARS